MKRQMVELPRKNLRPKFMNRIDEYIVFHLLDNKEINQIVKLHVIISSSIAYYLIVVIIFMFSQGCLTVFG